MGISPDDVELGESASVAKAEDGSVDWAKRATHEVGRQQR